MRVVLHLGVALLRNDLVTGLEDDFGRWGELDKAPRVASHSDVEVIEVMPTSDGETYGFKSLNGHPDRKGGRGRAY